MSGILNDPRSSFFCEEERCTNASKYESGIGGSYGHPWKPVTARELVNFHGIIVRDGVIGSSNGAIHLRWKEGDVCYNEEIANTMTLTRFGEIKRNLKLCINTSKDHPSRGQPG